MINFHPLETLLKMKCSINVFTLTCKGLSLQTNKITLLKISPVLLTSNSCIKLFSNNNWYLIICTHVTKVYWKEESKFQLSIYEYNLVG